MALIDSEHAFKKRCDELNGELAEKLKAQGITAFSILAFSIGSPQNPVVESELSSFAEIVFQKKGALGDTALLRRLHFEACTLLIADMKLQTECVDASEPARKLPFIEKQSRLEAQKKRINGLLHTPEHEPAHSLIDMVFTVMETGAILYIHPSRCHSREQEIQAESKARSKTFLTLEQGALKSTASHLLSDLDTGTELKVYFALLRRNLAFELLQFLSWDVCQLWLNKLMTCLVADTPAGFHSFQQHKSSRLIERYSPC